jgi:hypothetical protein
MRGDRRLAQQLLRVRVLPRLVLRQLPVLLRLRIARLQRRLLRGQVLLLEAGCRQQQQQRRRRKQSGNEAPRNFPRNRGGELKGS